MEQALFEKGAKVKVTRGTYEGCAGEISATATESAGFYWVWVELYRVSAMSFRVKKSAVKVLLSAGQLTPN